jgi:flagellar motor switch protein FliM
MENAENLATAEPPPRTATLPAPDATTANKNEGRTIAACNFRQTERLAAAQVRAVSTLNEAFARSLTRALAAYLRVSLECTLTSVEQAPYRDLLSRLPDLTYVASVVASSDRSVGLLQMDLDIVMPIIDLLLGGEGKPESNLRELTEVEQNVLEGVVRIVCHEVALAWQPLGVSFEFQGREQVANLPKLMAPDERTLALAFEITMPELKGGMRFVFPGLLANSLLRRLAREGEYHRPKLVTSDERMRELVMDCSFEFDLSFRGLVVPATDLVTMVPGQVLALHQPVQVPATASVAGVAMFSGHAARIANKRAAQIVDPLSSTQQRSGDE